MYTERFYKNETYITYDAEKKNCGTFLMNKVVNLLFEVSG